MKTLQQLQPMIIEWAKEKDLIKLENAPKQRLKLIEECGELASAILKNDIKEQKDAIGDIFVVLVILSEQLGKEIYFNNNMAYGQSIDAIFKDLISYVFDDDLDFIISELTGFCHYLNNDMTECANIAWNEIKNRTGKTIDGTFIKNE